MKRLVCIGILGALFACKTPNSSADLQSTGAFDTTTGKACLVWIKGEDVYYKHCPMQSECEPTDGRVVMAEKKYVEKVYEQFGVTDEKKSKVRTHLEELEAKYKNFLSIKAELEKIKESNPSVYAEEMQKAEERIFGTSLALEEAKSFEATLKARQLEAEKILASVRDLKSKKMSVLAVPEIAAALVPIFGKDISSCFDPAKASQMVASVAVQKKAEAEWNSYKAWKSASGTLPRCTPHVPFPSMRNLTRGWYDLKLSGDTINYSSLEDCNAARSGARAGVFCGWGHGGSNYYRVSDGRPVGSNPSVRLHMREYGKDIYPSQRTLKACIVDLARSAQIVSEFPGFIANPKYNEKGQRITDRYELVALWNGKILGEYSIPSPAQPPQTVRTTTANATPKQPNTNAIFSGQPPAGTGNGSSGNNSGNNSGANAGSAGNSAQVQKLIDAMKEVRSAFSYVSASTRDSCLSATLSSSEPWSDLMAHYYCQFPIQDDKNAYSVRACFTGTLRGQAPYQKAQGRDAAFKACIDRPEFAWLKADQNRAATFELIMAGGPNNISVSDQNKVITGFYGNSPVPVR